MKTTLLLALLASGFTTVQAQQIVPREETLKVAFLLASDLKQMLDTPIPTDPDVKRAVAMREGDRGGLFIPECKLEETIAKAGKEVVAVGQLWLRQTVPQSNGEPVKAEKLKTVSLQIGERTETAILCTLGLRKTGDKSELLIFGKDKNPIVTVPAKAISAKQENPIDASASIDGDVATITLKLAGKYEAALQFGGE